MEQGEYLLVLGKEIPLTNAILQRTERSEKGALPKQHRRYPERRQDLADFNPKPVLAGLGPGGYYQGSSPVSAACSGWGGGGEQSPVPWQLMCHACLPEGQSERRSEPHGKKAREPFVQTYPGLESDETQSHFSACWPRAPAWVVQWFLCSLGCWFREREHAYLVADALRLCFHRCCCCWKWVQKWLALHLRLFARDITGLRLLWDYGAVMVHTTPCSQFSSLNQG